MEGPRPGTLKAEIRFMLVKSHEIFVVLWLNRTTGTSCSEYIDATQENQFQGLVMCPGSSKFPAKVSSGLQFSLRRASGHVRQTAGDLALNYFCKLIFPFPLFNCFRRGERSQQQLIMFESTNKLVLMRDSRTCNWLCRLTYVWSGG